MKTFFKKKPYALFLAPGFVLYSIFVIYPIFAAGKLSLYKWNGIGEKVYVGISNYIELFTNSDLMSQMMNGAAGTGTGTDSNPMSAMMPFMMMNGGIGDVFDGMFDFSMDDTDTEDSEDDLEEDE